MSDQCRYRCDRCGWWFGATAEFRMPEVYRETTTGFALPWYDASGNPVPSKTPRHDSLCNGVVRREEITRRSDGNPQVDVPSQTASSDRPIAHAK